MQAKENITEYSSTLGFEFEISLVFIAINKPPLSLSVSVSLSPVFVFLRSRVLVFGVLFAASHGGASRLLGEQVQNVGLPSRCARGNFHE